MPDQTNIALLLSKLPADSLARHLVAAFEGKRADEGAKAAQERLIAVKAGYLKEPPDDPTKGT
jgi:hypothetical protein